MERGHHQSTRKSNHTLLGITHKKNVYAQVLADVLLKEKTSEIVMVEVIYAPFDLSK